MWIVILLPARNPYGFIVVRNETSITITDFPVFFLSAIPRAMMMVMVITLERTPKLTPGYCLSG